MKLSADDPFPRMTAREVEVTVGVPWRTLVDTELRILRALDWRVATLARPVQDVFEP